MLLVLVLGLVLHNAAMAQLWEVGVGGRALDVAAAWKEALLLAALVAAVWGARGLPRIKVVDVLALSYAGVIVAYALLPQGLLDGDATARGELLALRHHLLPVAAYALGRLVSRLWQERSRLGGAIVLAAVVVAVAGLVDLAVLSLQSWRDSGVPGWYREQLGLDYEGLSGLPENWVYNTGDEESPMRRLVATLLSPLASAYVLVVALVYVVSRRLTIWWACSRCCCTWASCTRTRGRRSQRSPSASSCSRSPSAGSCPRCWLPSPSQPARRSSSRTPRSALDELHGGGARVPAPERRGGAGGEHGSPVAVGVVDRSHLRNLRDGMREVLEHPQGYGLGNAGRGRQADRRRDQGGRVHLHGDRDRRGHRGHGRLPPLEPRPARFAAAARGVLGAAFAGVLLLALQTDVIGVHWLAVAVWRAAGVALGSPRRERQVRAAPDSA